MTQFTLTGATQCTVELTPQGGKDGIKFQMMLDCPSCNFDATLETSSSQTCNYYDDLEFDDGK